MGLDRLGVYKELVEKRKSCRRCIGLTDPWVIRKEYDSEEIGPWSLWQGSLNARILLVGQDWGDIEYYLRHRGRDEDTNPTNQNLIRLFESIDVPIMGPNDNAKNEMLFFTNAILCLKQGRLSSKTDDTWYSNCGELFLRPLIELINPRIVIALGEKAYGAIASLYGLRMINLREAVEECSPIGLPGDRNLFPVYHCGVRGVNINRAPFERHIEDWKKIGYFLKSNGENIGKVQSANRRSNDSHVPKDTKRAFISNAYDDTRILKEEGIVYLDDLPIKISDADFERMLIGKSQNTTIPYMRRAKELIKRGLLTRGTDRKAIDMRTEIIGGTLDSGSETEGRIYLLEDNTKVTLLWKGQARYFRENYMRIRDERAGQVPYRLYGRAYYK